MLKNVLTNRTTPIGSANDSPRHSPKPKQNPRLEFHHHRNTNTHKVM